MSRAVCCEPSCEWEAEAPTVRIARSLLERHFAQVHNDAELEF